MALNIFETRQSNFFKYRYVQPFPVNFGTIQETWEMQSQAFKYNFTSEFLHRSSNMKINYEDHKIDYIDFVKIYQSPREFYDKHVIVFPIQLSFFEKVKDVFTPSSPFESSGTVIVTGPPKKIVSHTMSFLAMDSQVLTLMTTSVIIISTILTLHWFLRRRIKISSTRQIIKKSVKIMLKNVWKNASLLCAEPIPNISPEVTVRVIFSVWLISATIILFFLGCFLKTEFTTVTYDTLNSLEDVMASNLKPLIIRGGIVHDYLKILATGDEAVNNWFKSLTEDNFCTLMELLDLDGYMDVLSGESVLIISKTYLTWLIGEVLTRGDNSKEIITSMGGLYISDEIHTDYLHIIYNTSFINNSPEIREIGQISVYPIFESKPYSFLDFVFTYPLDYVTWTRPKESISELKISQLTTPFHLLVMLAIVSATLVTLEILF